MSENGRVPPKVPFTMMEKMVAMLVGRGLAYEEIGERFNVAKSTVKMHAENAAGKLPGGDPPRMKLQIWWRGGDREMLAPRAER